MLRRGESVNSSMGALIGLQKQFDFFDYLGIFTGDVVRFARIRFKVVKLQRRGSLGLHRFPIPHADGVPHVAFVFEFPMEGFVPVGLSLADNTGKTEMPSMPAGGLISAMSIAVGRKSQAAQVKSPTCPAGIFPGMDNHRHLPAAFVKIAATATKRPGALEKFWVHAAVGLRPGIAGKENHRVAFKVQLFQLPHNWPMLASRRVIMAALFFSSCGHGSSENGASVGSVPFPAPGTV